MKLLYIIDSLKSGGKERRLVSLIKGLLDFDNIEIGLIVLDDEIHYDYILDYDIKIYYLKRDIRKDVKIIFRFNKILKSFKPGIVHCWDNIAAIHFAPLCKFKRIPFINSMISAAPQNLSKLSKRYIVNLISYPFSTIILSNSHAGLKSFYVSKKKGICIHNGFDMGRIEGKLNSDNIRRKFGINTKYIVGMTASFTKMKDYKTFVQSAELLLNKRNDTTFVAIGDGPELNAIRFGIKNEIKDSIKFVGKQKDVESIVNIFDIGVLSTFSEGISNAIMEYMALSKPVIATKGGGTNELVLDGKTGFLIKQKNPELLALKINFLLNHPDIAEKMRNEGRIRIENNFSINKMVQETYNLYCKVLN